MKANNRFWTKVSIATDVLTIAVSGGTLTLSISTARKAWALMEIVGAVGNLSIETGAVPDNTRQWLQPIINSYNAVLGVLDIGGVAVVNLHDWYKKVRNFASEEIILDKLQAFDNLTDNPTLVFPESLKPRIETMKRLAKRELSRARGKKLSALDPLKVRQYSAKNLTYRGDKVAKGIHFFKAGLKRKNGVVDVVVHSEGSGFVVYISKADGVEQKLNLSTSELAEILSSLPNPPATIRLLSCADLENAKELAQALKRPVVATKGIVDIYPDGGIKSSTNVWKKYNPDGTEESFATPTPPSQAYLDTGKFVRLGTWQFADADIHGNVKMVLRGFEGNILDELNDALVNDIDFHNRISKITEQKINQNADIWFAHEEIAYEIFEKVKGDTNFNTFYSYCEDFLTKLSKNKQNDFNTHFKAWRYVFKLKQNTPPRINISLGSRLSAPLTEYDGQFNSVSFTAFYDRGFIDTKGIEKMTSESNWLPLVAKAIHKSYKNGGITYFHLDGLDLTALHLPSHINHKSGTITELKFVIDKGLVNKQKVKFKLKGNDLTPQEVQDLQLAISKWESLVRAASVDSYRFYGGIYYN